MKTSLCFIIRFARRDNMLMGILWMGVSLVQLWSVGMGGLEDGFAAPSVCISYEAKYMKIEARKTSPRFIFGSGKVMK